MKFAHIINPVKVTEKSDLFIAQPVTFESMRRAQKNAELSRIDVELHYTCYEEDLPVVPDGFIKDELLRRSILDIHNFKVKRKLPLIKDILDAVIFNTDADYIIYTNVDIALMPYFYNTVKKFIEEGYDGFVINRRTVNNKWKSVDELELMYSDVGSKHPGFDCFVFKKNVYDNYYLGDACIGANWIGRVLISNVIANAKKFKVFEDEHLSFHIGDDRSWKVKEFNNYDKSNEKVVIELLQKKLTSEIKNHSLIQSFMQYHLDDVSTNELYDFSNVKTDNKFFELFNKKSPLNQSPLFIVGFPRSGTTFLLNTLISQDSIHSLPETHFFDIVNKNNDIAEETDFSQMIFKIEKWTPLSEDAKEFLQYCFNNNKLNEKLIFETIICDYLLKQVSDSVIENITWIEKTPDHCLYLDKIYGLYPNAKFIHILRNPVNTFNSWRRVGEGWGATWKPVEEYSTMWLDRLESSEQFKAKHQNELMFITLEQFRKNLNYEIKKICNFIKIDFREELLHKKNNKSEFLFLENETWKNDAVQSEVIQSDKSSDSDITPFEEFRIGLMLNYKLKKFKYNIDYIEKFENNTFDDLLDKNEIEKTLLFYEQNPINKKYGGENKYEDLLDNLRRFIFTDIKSHPINKYKAYLDVIKEYYKLKG